ncbi:MULTISPECIES: capsular polysaccharide synthesis protein [unclassified Mesorhizobium]|uniref:capsular polysaccharide synthesis protein n=1 Tax=unclassified Mesorhizobium TaxID=325217 RepID=UPI000BB07BA1|nr:MULTISPECIES: capsular polysaccharide synthesis protein [unclassified Mesorhizobium]TGT60797.1 hypothetical protein EN813_024290 [Mesorhizobium sp. M00.F.Ca.ET.170.01.1.1]AZO10103.1 hypothetical protein EJ074_14040 [Mesorhizobium sp. M3A.F.Ca.ET.080.04.2.1]PBB86560.1 hypothetical protein CK216_13055 [Mesorhizobium sp. WSM3876]RWB75790.1 MAG: hypothetical protein EOQ49_04735 [Mesorhizobium sp.]RWB91541.1 MAG: hypothetical protein EOQ52_04095 [Mesorhizobium sp.]
MAPRTHDFSESSFFSEAPFNDPLKRPYLAPLRWAASSQVLPWSLRACAAKTCATLARRRDWRARSAAVDHSKWCSTSTPSSSLGPIWQYWAQGVDDAPPVVKACLHSVQLHKGGRELVILDDRTVGDYIDLPGHVWDKRRRGLMNRQHFSNFIRLSLLARHGGTWLDATILLRQPVPAQIEDEEFYILRETSRAPRLVETWFIHARKGHPLVETVLHNLADYWKTHDRLLQYFMFPHHMEAALLLHRRLRCDFLRMPQVGADRPHGLQRALLEPFDEAVHREIYDGFWLHKLTHKFQRPAIGGRLLWDAIIDGWPHTA